MFNKLIDFFFDKESSPDSLEIDEMKLRLDSIINKLTDIDGRFTYLYFYGNSLSKDEKQFTYNEIKSQLKKSQELLSEVKSWMI